MRLDELFDRTIPYKWDQQSNDYWQAKFHVDSVEYSVICSIDNSGWIKPSDPDTLLPCCDMSFGPTENYFAGTEVTGTDKKEFQIFATVLSAFREFLRTVKPEYIRINAYKGNSNRFKLYAKMARRFEPELASMGYKPGECLIYKHIDVTKDFDSLCFERK